jgi:ribonuclease D
VSGYFITRISFMMEKGKASQLQTPLTELTTDELYSLLVGNKAIDIAHTANFDVASFRSDIKKNMN